MIHAGPERDREFPGNWWVNGIQPDGRQLWPDAPPRTCYANGLHNNVRCVLPEWRNR